MTIRDAIGQPPVRRSDGVKTHEAILDAAMRMASIDGLGNLSIGGLARELGISKSGVFAHFRSKQRLQRETLEAATEVLNREVIAPGMAAPQGLGQLEGVCEAYLSYIERGVFPGGCFFAQLLADFDAPAGSIHDELMRGQRGWLDMLGGLATMAVHRGELDEATDVTQLAFNLYAPLELANYLSTLYRDQSFVDRARAAIRSAIDAARAG